MAEAEEKLGRKKHALAYAERRHAVGEFSGGRQVSAWITLARFRFLAGHRKAALAACDEALRAAKTGNSRSDVSFAKEQTEKLLAAYPPTTWQRLGFGN